MSGPAPSSVTGVRNSVASRNAPSAVDARRPTSHRTGGSMAAVASALDNLTLSVTQEILVRSSVGTTFAALLEQMGPGNEGHDGRPLPMTLEAWPGGRWFRDLGNRD